MFLSQQSVPGILLLCSDVPICNPPVSPPGPWCLSSTGLWSCLTLLLCWTLWICTFPTVGLGKKMAIRGSTGTQCLRWLQSRRPLRHLVLQFSFVGRGLHNPNFVKGISQSLFQQTGHGRLYDPLKFICGSLCSLQLCVRFLRFRFCFDCFYCGVGRLCRLDGRRLYIGCGSVRY